MEAENDGETLALRLRFDIEQQETPQEYVVLDGEGNERAFGQSAEEALLDYLGWQLGGDALTGASPCTVTVVIIAQRNGAAGEAAPREGASRA